MNIRHQLSVRLRRVTIPVMAIVVVLMGLAVQDVASASRGVVRVDVPGTGAVDLYGSSHALVIGIDAYNASSRRLG